MSSAAADSFILFRVCQAMYKIRYETPSRELWREEEEEEDDDDNNNNGHYLEVHAEKETRVLE
jgi:hypothetical protein